MEVVDLFPEMRIFVSGLRGIDKLNVCDNCKSAVGCEEYFPGALYQKGKCSLCGYEGNIVNVAIARKVMELKINPIEYATHGQLLVYSSTHV